MPYVVESLVVDEGRKTGCTIYPDMKLERLEGLFQRCMIQKMEENIRLSIRICLIVQGCRELK